MLNLGGSTFVLARETAYATRMLRIAFRVLLALAFALQGSVGAGVAIASAPHGHHCHSSPGHDGKAQKCPCCPAKSFGMTCADMCVGVAALPSLPATFKPPVFSLWPAIERIQLVVSVIETPLRPPIA